MTLLYKRCSFLLHREEPEVDCNGCIEAEVSAQAIRAYAAKLSNEELLSELVERMHYGDGIRDHHAEVLRRLNRV